MSTAVETRQGRGHRVEQGYRVEKVLGRLTYPTNVEFSRGGALSRIVPE
ncbi:MAG: hypothetical protein IBX62_01175 [Coriobacteriia bacterium]|nr:hypothetical protein [Coriobacteriia bacterium]